MFIDGSRFGPRVAMPWVLALNEETWRWCSDEDGGLGRKMVIGWGSVIFVSSAV